MTYSSRADKLEGYRRATAEVKAPVGQTFHCTVCGNRRSIIGRKFVGKIGSRQLFACAPCVADRG